jgi:hypothetical protein
VKDDEVNGFSVEQNRPGMPTTGGTRGEQNKQFNTTT